MRLRLREELVVELGPDANAIKDPLLVRTVSLGPTGIALVPLLDGTREIAEVVAAMEDAGFARTKIEDSIRGFTLLLLFEGIGDAVRARIAAIWRGEVELPYLSLPGTRFACQASGLCCRSYRLGPVSADEQVAINALPLREVMPDLPEGDLFLRRGENLYLATGKGAQCVFQRPNGLCGIHAHFGEAAKPLTCKFYPTGVMATFAGERLYNNQHCASHFVAQDQGPLLVESARLLRPKATGQVTLFHPIVFVREDTPVDYAYFLVLEAALRSTLGGAGAPFGQLAAALGVLDSFVTFVRALPLGEDPEPILAGWRAEEAAAAESVDWGRVVGMIGELVDELHGFLEAADGIENDDRNMAPLARELLPVLRHLHRRALGCAGHHAIIDERVERAVAGTDDIAAALRTSMAQVFYGRLGLPDDRPLFALGQIAIAFACGFVNAQQIAVAEGRPYGTLDLSRGHALANRVLPTFTKPYFARDPDRARALVLALPALAAWRQNAQE